MQQTTTSIWTSTSKFQFRWNKSEIIRTIEQSIESRTSINNIYSIRILSILSTFSIPTKIFYASTLYSMNLEYFSFSPYYHISPYFLFPCSTSSLTIYFFFVLPVYLPPISIYFCPYFPLFSTLTFLLVYFDRCQPMILQTAHYFTLFCKHC